MDSELPPPPPQVIAAAQANRKVEAIKPLRQHRGIDLKEAKTLVDIYLAENPQLTRERPQQQASGLGRLVLTGIIAVLAYGLYDYFFAGNRQYLFALRYAESLSIQNTHYRDKHWIGPDQADS